MAVDVTWFAPIAVDKPEPKTSVPNQTPSARLPRRIGKGLWNVLVNVISGPGLDGGGIDESAFPSSFKAPYGKGSRQIRSLEHLFF